MLGHIEDNKIKESIKDLQKISSQVKILGSYPRAY
jgi:prephenate dehydratase